MQDPRGPERRATAGAGPASFVTGLLWAALFTGVACGVSVVVELVFVDFIHGNPHRTQSDALVMMLFTPLIGVIGFLGVLLVFGVPQLLQAIILEVIAKSGPRRECLILVILPLTALCAWYSYDYLIPFHCHMVSEEGPDYEHGLTSSRYIVSLALQASITVFSLILANLRPRRRVLMASFLLAIAAGAILGHVQAETQYKFLSGAMAQFRS